MFTRRLFLLSGVPFFRKSVKADSEITEKLKSLPIYDKPPQTEYEYIEEPKNAYRDYVSSARKTVFKYLESVGANAEWVHEKYSTGKAHTEYLITTLRDDKSQLMRAGVITISALGGIIAGYRGGRIRKTIYGTVGALASSSICYPEQAIHCTKTCFDFASREAKNLWHSTVNKDSRVTPVKSNSEEHSSVPTDSKQENVKLDESKTDMSKLDESKLDYGMSKKEDKDLYTTRES